MGKGGGRPEAPDPYKTASAEAQFNRVDTYSPSGSGVRHGYTDNQGQFQIGVAPQGRQSAQSYVENDYERAIRQALEPASVDLTNRVIADNITGMPDAARVKDRSDVARDMFDRSFSLMAPGIEQANSRLLTNLQARGIPMGSEAFNETYGEQTRNTQDTIARLAMDSNLAAGQEQTRQFGLDQAERGGAIAELVAAMGGGYNPPNATPSGQAAGVDYSGLVGEKYRADLADYNASQQSKMGVAGTLGQLGSALIKSSILAKDVHQYANIHHAANVVQSMPVYLWSYKDGQAPDGDHGGKHVGPMAQDFHRMTGLGEDETISVTDYLGVVMSALQSALVRIAYLESQVWSQEDDDEAEPAPVTARLH